MPESPSQPVSCPVLVLRIEEAQVMGDTLAERLRDDFLGRLASAGARNVVIDFAPVKFLSSAGFRPLLSLLKEVRGRGGRLILCGLSPDVEETLRVTRLITTGGSSPAAFEAQPHIADAIAALDLQTPPPASA
jgi:anti-anti-sigma factor